MSKFDKALARLKAKPKDFTWKELQSILSKLGYKELKGGGSRRKFINDSTKSIIILHEPHPKPILKLYAIELVIEHLKERKLI
ncbi:MAG TPA: type II toxin-antitoxin system HicA family toxin [Cyclobacteriaceae bacterium]|nr:type II toxin-antitoxin system HicA family toxin [Cyclobacteriaceae bacterium]